MIVSDDFSISLDEAFTFLDNSEYLTEQESAYFPAMVPIIENSRLGMNIIRLEDLVNYSLANNISEAGYAINQICESASIDISNIGFSVKDTSIIEDSEIEDTVKQFTEAGLPVFVSQISDNDPSYILAEAVINKMIEDDLNDYLLEAYVYDDIDTILNEGVVDTISTPFKAMGRGVATVGEKMKSNWRHSKKWASKKIASLTKALSKMKDKTTGFVKPKFKAIANKITGAIDYLKDKIKRK